jgi:hypothetical protein
MVTSKTHPAAGPTAPGSFLPVPPSVTATPTAISSWTHVAVSPGLPLPRTHHAQNRSCFKPARALSSRENPRLIFLFLSLTHLLISVPVFAALARSGLDPSGEARPADAVEKWRRPSRPRAGSPWLQPRPPSHPAR